MNIEKNLTKLIAVSAICGILGMGFGFAALSQTLTINGTADIVDSNWDIHFDNLQDVSLVGNASELTAPTINNSDTTLSSYDVTLSAPGDSVSYTFDIVNAGDIDAKISSMTLTEPTCTGTGDNATTDASSVCNYLSYSLTYTAGGSVASGNTLASGETKSVILKLEYKDESQTTFATNDVSISNLGFTISYIQDTQ